MFRFPVLVIWVSLMASSFVISGWIAPFADPISSTGLRFIFGTLIMYPFVAKRIKRYLTIDIVKRYLFISLSLVLFFIGLFQALYTTTAINTSVIYTGVPLLCVVISFVFLREQIDKFKTLGFVIGMAGAIWVLLVSRQIAFDQLDWVQGDWIFLLACISLASHVLLIKHAGIQIPPDCGAFLILMLGSAILTPFMVLMGDLNSVHWESAVFWKGLLYLTVFTTLLTFSLQQYIIHTMGPNMLMGFSYFIPSLVALMSGLFSGDIFLYSFPGILLTMIAVYLISADSYSTGSRKTDSHLNESQPRSLFQVKGTSL